MLSPLTQFLARKPTCSFKPSRPPTPNPLCGLRDLCAMLLRLRSFSHGSQRVHSSPFCPRTPNPLCGLRVLCAMLSRLTQFLARKPTCSSKPSRPRTLNPPLWPIQLKRRRTISGPSPSIRRGIPRLAQVVGGIEKISSSRPRELYRPIRLD
jgi:hypothetical protein